ncbi:MAG: hypothetical protein H6579_06570 [Chitinophagales bacterium]|nr:hypothetical protein [Chitinophagales bacterium]
MRYFYIIFVILFVSACSKDETSTLRSGDVNNNGSYKQLNLSSNTVLEEVGCLHNTGEIRLDLDGNGIDDLIFVLEESIPDVSQECCQVVDSTVDDSCFPYADIAIYLMSNEASLKIGVDDNAYPLMLSENELLSGLTYNNIETRMILARESGSMGFTSSKGNWIDAQSAFLPLSFEKNNQKQFAWIKLSSQLNFYHLDLFLVDYFVEN